MDDGTFNKGKVFLCTHSFSYEENILLSKVITTKFNIPCTLIKRKQPKKDGEFWYNIKFNDTNLLWLNLKDYILPFFYYKFGRNEKL